MLELRDMFTKMVAAGASDLHLVVDAPPQLRIRGELQTIDGYGPLTPEETRELVFGILTNEQRQKLEVQWEIDFSYAVPGLSRWRVNAFFQRGAVGAAFRIIPEKIRALSDLKVPDSVYDLCDLPRGLVLVTGPTGSGKTTTLYAFINSINTDNINIQTIEDPIEYEIEGINQTQTDPYHGITFATGLRSLLRCDPDVILVGESRDPETAQASINAALTGHLVFTTLHANDSLRAVSRLMSMGVETYLLSDALCLSQAQRLVRRLCAYCKTPTPISAEIGDYLARNGVLKDGKVPTTPIYNKGGCPECNNTGYSGRVALMEMCMIDQELQALIARGAPMPDLRKAALKTGLLSLYQEGLTHVIAGNTTLEEIACLSYTAAGDGPSLGG